MVELWNGLKALLESTLVFFHGYVSDYGVAIILLTLAVRVVLLPLTVKQTKSMLEMQRVQPKLRALQEKYKDDKEKLQQELMKFYSEHKINPLGGCLPMLLQLPVMIALFRMLLQSDQVKRATFLGLMELSKAARHFWPLTTANLLDALPYYLMLVIVVLTTYIPQKMITSDPQQSRMMLGMTGLMGVISWQLPTGVLLYWVTTNVWTIVQQYVTLKVQGGQREDGGGRGGEPGGSKKKGR